MRSTRLLHHAERVDNKGLPEATAVWSRRAHSELWPTSIAHCQGRQADSICAHSRRRLPGRAACEGHKGPASLHGHKLDLITCTASSSGSPMVTAANESSVDMVGLQLAQGFACVLQ